MYRVSFGLVSVLLSVLLLARNLDLIPDPDATANAKRQAACEAVAIECAMTAHRKQDPAAAMEFVQAVARRNPEILSVGVRDSDGKLVIDTGNHETHWNGYSAERSSPTHMQVAISRDDGSRWGRVEVCFLPLPYSGAWRFLGGSFLPLLAFVWVGSFIVTSLYDYT